LHQRNQSLTIQRERYEEKKRLFNLSFSVCRLQNVIGLALHYLCSFVVDMGISELVVGQQSADIFNFISSFNDSRKKQQTNNVTRNQKREKVHSSGRVYGNYFFFISRDYFDTDGNRVWEG